VRMDVCKMCEYGYMQNVMCASPDVHSLYSLSDGRGGFLACVIC